MAKDAIAHPERPRPRAAMMSVDGGRIQVRAELSRPEPDGCRKGPKVAVPETYQVAVDKRWIQAAWSVQVATIPPELEARFAGWGSPPECVDGDARSLVSESLRHLKNNAERMRRDQCRRQGLPIMTIAVESAIEMINGRVKGSEKSWSGPGAEAILQLRADGLGETETMGRFRMEREAQASDHRPCRNVA